MITLAEVQATGFATTPANYDAIAAALSVGRTKLVSRLVSERGILGEFGDPVAADAMLTKLEAFGQTQHPLASVTRRALKFLATPEGIDLGSPAVHTMLDALVAGGVITEAEATKVKDMAVEDDPVTALDVSRVIEGAV